MVDEQLPYCSGRHPGGPESDLGARLLDHTEKICHSFRTSDPPMPVFVLHAQDAEDDAKVSELVRQLCEAQRAHGSRCAVLTDDGRADENDDLTEGQRGAALVRALADSDQWGGSDGVYRRYAFPRLGLVHAIGDAVRTLGDDWPSGGPEQRRNRERRQKLLDQLAKQRWRPHRTSDRRRGLPLFDMAHAFPASLLAGFSAMLARAPWYWAVGTSAGFMLLLTLLSLLPGRAPIFLWLRRESRWFLTTTFLSDADLGRPDPTDVSLLRPIRSWKAIAARACDVAEALKAGGDFQLQLCVEAMREDFRDNHRRWSWDLRGFKRIRPPMLFLPDATAEDGGLQLIRAISDVRGRRSPLDPLLVVASVRAADVRRLDSDTPPGPDTGTPRSGAAGQGGVHGLRQWATDLRVHQSLSRDRGVLPWVLNVPVPGEQLEPKSDRHRRASTRPTPARMFWALHSLLLVIAVLAASMVVRAMTLHDQHCSASLLTANRETERLRAPGGGTECIGVATGDVRFADWLPKPDAQDQEGVQSFDSDVPWSLGDLERRVAAQNREVLGGHTDRYVTIVYAGPLSVGSDGETSPVKGVEELAGVYLAQAVINKSSTVKLRVVIANGGVDLNHQEAMARAIARYAAQDPTVVGVVGTGRDLKSSARTTRILMQAGLPVVSGTNSATYLPEQFANWFSLAAPDEWQVEQLGLIAAQLRDPAKPQYAMVLARNTAETEDMYTDEQARYGRRMLSEQGFTLLKEHRYALRGGSPELRTPTEQICGGPNVPQVIYFAGRVEDVDPLMTQLGALPGCADKEIAVFTGDDVTKATFARGKDAVAPKVTLYHAALAALDEAAAGTDFYQDAARYLPGLDPKEIGPDSAALTSGQIALSHDATQALWWAATRDGAQSAAATWVNLRTVDIGGMATGNVDFTDAPLYASRTGHSIALKEVRRTADGTAELRVVCSRIAGDVRRLTQKECAVSPPSA